MPVRRPKRMSDTPLLDTLLPGPRPIIQLNEYAPLFQQFHPKPARGSEPTFDLDARDLYRQTFYPRDSRSLSSLGSRTSNERTRIREHAGPAKVFQGRQILSEPLPGPRWHEGPQLPVEIQNLLRPVRDPDELQPLHTLDILEPDAYKHPEADRCPMMDFPFNRIPYQEHSGVPPIKGIFLERVIEEIRIPELQDSLLNQGFRHLPPVANSDARVRALEFQDPATIAANQNEENQNSLPTAGNNNQNRAAQSTENVDSYQYNNGLPGQGPTANPGLPFSNHGLPNLQQPEIQADEPQIDTNDSPEQDGVADNSPATMSPRIRTPTLEPTSPREEPPHVASPPLTAMSRALDDITNRATTTRGRTVSPIRGESPRMRENRSPREENRLGMKREDSGYSSQDRVMGRIERLR
ncbi:hypothetical protein B0J14DRAFT_640944 [Halenospora varia]|nr:hypothetical protein B0J14DRAFT_640944 [Halenospora varia]